MSLSCIILGAGNLAVNLGVNLKQRGIPINQVYSRTIKSASELAEKLEVSYTINPREIMDADVCFVVLNDAAIPDILEKVNFNNRLVVHCSGTLPLQVLHDCSENTGVFYPLQTFSKHKILKFERIPIFIEANTPKNEQILRQLAEKLSDTVQVMNSDDRKYLHIAAVFSCNFANHLYTISSEILKSKEISFDLLRPLIKETTEKVLEFSPSDAQTGPAVRSDINVMSSHLEELKRFPEYAGIYQMISASISKYYQNRKNVVF